MDSEPCTSIISSHANNRFHVFLSFRGPDVRNTFVDHLYAALSEAGLRVFLDSEELEKGKGIDSSLQSAIETSDILIPIFSKRYAESTWCLEEAARMCRSNGFIIPLFSDVQPCDVRYPQRNGGAFAKAFEKHYTHLDRHGENTIEEWNSALHQISGFSGWSLEAESGSKSLPCTIGDLAQLRKLNLSRCSDLKNLPDTIGNLAELKELSLQHCSGLQTLPSTVGKLQNLQNLDIEGSSHNTVVKLAQLREANRRTGLRSLAQKEFNVYFGFCVADADDIVETLMGHLQKCVRIRSGREEEQGLCTESLRICRGRLDDQSRDILRAIESSDIIVPIFLERYSGSRRQRIGEKATRDSNCLIVPFYPPHSSVSGLACERCLFP